MALTKVKLIADGTIVQSNLHASHGITTADIGENASYLYYTDTRARAAVSVSGNALSYNSSTGVITSNYEESPVFTGTVTINNNTPLVLNGTDPLISFQNGGSNHWQIGFENTQSDRFIFYDNNAASYRMVINSSGNVGIGTTLPNTKLNIGASGIIRVNSDSASASNFLEYYYNASYNHGLAVEGDRGLRMFSQTGESTAKLTFYTEGQERMRIDSSGYVTIGDISSAPSGTVPLTIFKSGANANLAIQSGGGSGRKYELISNTAGDFIIYDVNGTTEKLNITAAGNVGIGTSSPRSKLDVNGLITQEYGNAYQIKQGSTEKYYYSNGASYNAFGTGVLGIGTTGDAIQFATNNFVRATINSSGNVGIGVVPNAVTAGNIRLDVGYVGCGITSRQNAELVLTSNADYVTATTTGRNAIMVNLQNNGDFNILNAPSTTAGSALTFTSRFYINTSGNVGIGTTSPQVKLEIYGSFRARGDQNALIELTNTSGNTKAYLGNAGNEGDLGLYTSSNVKTVYLSSYYNSYFNGNGNVGIGTSSPSAKLQIDNTSGNTLALRKGTGTPAIAFGGTNANEAVGLLEGIAGGGFKFYTGAGTLASPTWTERMRVTSGGKILVGTTSTSAAGRLQIDSGTNINGGILDIQNSGSYRYYTRVCHTATVSGNAGYWHIKTNIAVSSGTMFFAKFYGYIYGSSQILDLTHVGYAYGGTNSVINQGTTNNGSDPNASSAIYISANGSKVTFRIAFGSGSNFSTYFAGVFMDMAFPSPANQGIDFEIEAQTFSTSTTVY